MGDLKRHTVHMIGNAHIDSAWKWRWPESIEVCKMTFRSALERMNETPDFTFACSSAAHYLWMEENAPDIFDEIRDRVREGRWEIVGGWWVQPDINIPSGEAFVRQALYAQRYFQQKFGRTATVGYNPDSFGHTGALPQLLAKCGIDSYVFFRPGPHEKTLPSGTFWWESPDGTRVLASRPPHHYGFLGDRTDMFERIDGACRETPAGLNDVLCFYGVGDHGGGPTKETISAICAARDDPDMPGVQFGLLGEFFARARASDAELPVVKDELQHHASGCYAVHSRIKQRNRQCEQLLVSTEKLATLAAEIADAEHSTEQLERAWRNVLFNQFHDILAGTSIPPVYDDADEMYDESERIATTVREDALDAILESINTLGDGQAIVVFNPTAWTRKSPVEVELRWEHRLESMTLTDSNGKTVPYQFVQSSKPDRTGYVRIVFVAEVPSLGYATYRCVPTPKRASKGPAAPKDASGMENAYWRLEFDPETGCVKRLYDKRAKMDVFSGDAAVPVVMKDMSDTWSHDVFSFHDEIGRFADGSLELVEDGPVRTVMRAKNRYRHSTIVQDFALYRKVRTIDCRMTVDWHEQSQLLKLAFPVNVGNPVATYETPYGHIVRPADGEEEPGQQWVDVTGTAIGNTTYGLSILNDSKYSFDILGSTMSVTVLRSPPYALHDPRKESSKQLYEYIDQGVQHLAYSLVPHRNKWQNARTVRRARELNAPLIPVLESSHDGDLPHSLSYLQATPENVLVNVVKRAEDSDDIVLRFYETDGKAANARIRIPIRGFTWEDKLGPHEITTIKITEYGDAVEIDMLEMHEM